jgi:hypothetical protein
MPRFEVIVGFGFIPLKHQLISLFVKKNQLKQINALVKKKIMNGASVKKKTAGCDTNLTCNMTSSKEKKVLAEM